MIISPKKEKALAKKKAFLDSKIEKRTVIDMLGDIFRTSLQDEANIHSCRLEYCADSAYKTEEDFRREKFEECLDGLNHAWDWGTKNFTSDFKEDFFVEIVKKVENGFVKGYREKDVRPTGSDYTPPRVMDNKMRKELDIMMENIERGKQFIKEGKISPVELAILTHFHLVRIHPFDDGNGRTSRLMQNFILNHYEFPVSVIYKGERSEYVNHLKTAQYAHRYREQNNNYWENLSEEESQTYDYLASKASISLDFVIDGIYKK